MEQWKQIKGSNRYWVSNTGKVMSKYNNGKTKVLKGWISEGYPNVQICQDGKQVITKVHRLVAEAFIPNPDNCQVVRHIDDVRHNNHISNLLWGSQKDNMDDKYSKDLIIRDLQKRIQYLEAELASTKKAPHKEGL